MENNLTNEMLAYSENPIVNKPKIERVFNRIMDKLDIPRKEIICLGSLNEWHDYRKKTQGKGKFKESKDTDWDYLLFCGWFAVLFYLEHKLYECSDRKKDKHSKSCREMLLIFGKCCSAKVEKIYWYWKLQGVVSLEWTYTGYDWIRHTSEYISGKKKNRTYKQKIQDIDKERKRYLQSRTETRTTRQRTWVRCCDKAFWNAAVILKGFVKAEKNGLLDFWMYKDCIVYIVKPKVCINQDGLLSNNKKEAVLWENGEKYWFLNGVKVTQEIVETPAEKLDPKIILTEKNAEVRREIIRRIGIERVCHKLDTKAIDRSADGMYELLSLGIDDRKRPYLKMRNPSISTYHIEGVGKECKTVAQALAFRMKRLTDKAILISENGQDWYQQGDVIVYPKGAKVVKPMPAILT